MIAIIMPIYNGESTLAKTLESLFLQSMKFDELIIIDDASIDSSEKIINDCLSGKIKYQLIRHEENAGLAKTYNEGIKLAQSDLIVTLHQDVILEPGALQKLIEPFDDDGVVATSHVVSHPLEIWNSYNFWQKCFFARLAGKDFFGIDGKFDGFRKSALLKVGLFDEEHFHSAGEDGDLVFRLKEIGRISQTDARIVHLHKIDLNFNWRDIIHKQKQYSEVQGVLLRLGEIDGLKNIFKSFFREFLVLSLVVPYLNILALGVILVYSFWYTRLVYWHEFGNPRIAVLPIFNSYLLLVSFVFSIKGFVFKKQQI